MNYLEGLNGAQKQAVLAIDGPVSVLAGAGAGKTRVLATRIYHLIRQGVPGNHILAVTFTNKAAREMRERVRALLGSEQIAARSEFRRATAREEAIFQQKNTPLTSSSNSELPFIATFHGLGRELLESYGKVIGVPRFFSIFDREDSERAINAALKALDVNTKELSPRAVLARISKAKGQGISARDFYEKQSRASFSARIVAEAWLRYEETLKGEKALDFDDLISLPVYLLEKHEDVRAKAQERWQYVHIDEYQDTNALQGRLANLLAGKHRNLFVVGDIDQTIYTWRGATIDNLLTFEETYPEAKVIVLELNYRSTKTIVEAANTVIEKNQKRKEKKSVTDNPRGELITIHSALNAEDEARWIARLVGELIRRGTPPEAIAILFRTNFQSRALEEGLLRAGIPYKLLGTRFFERKEVKDVLAWVRLALDSSREADRMRAAQFPPRGIGKSTLGKLVAGKREELRAGEKTKVETFEKIIQELGAASEHMPPSDFVRLVIEKSGMRKNFEAGGEEGAERFENIQELATIATRHDGLPGKEGIAAFLAEAALASDQDELDRNENRKTVTLMTVHAAKGLEFNTVFVTGMEEGLFPHEGMHDEERDEEEERRLFYVAMTRARHRLVLTLAKIRRIYGTDYLSEPSSFLRDIDSEHLIYDETEGEDVIEL